MKKLLNIASRLAKGRPEVGATPADTVHRENKWRLLRYRPRPEGLAYETPILLIPSLINRHYVLDLMPGKSFAEFLVAQGHDVFIVDWGTPGDEDRYLTFDEICDRYLGRAVRKTARIAGVYGRPHSQGGGVHLLGYCLGGTLTSIYTAARPEHVRSMVALAAPVDFSDDGTLATWMNNPSFDVDAIVDACGNVPWPLMQVAFHLLKPTLNLVKAVGVLDRAWDDQFLDGFFAIETWGNDNVSFPGEAYRRYIVELYQNNALVEGRFALSGHVVHLSNITCPLLSVAFNHDHIVPLASAAPLVEMVSSEDKEQWDLRGGHVGAVISRRASRTLWPALSNWWAQRDARFSALEQAKASA